MEALDRVEEATAAPLVNASRCTGADSEAAACCVAKLDGPRLLLPTSGYYTLAFICWALSAGLGLLLMALICVLHARVRRRASDGAQDAPRGACCRGAVCAACCGVCSLVRLARQAAHLGHARTV